MAVVTLWEKKKSRPENLVAAARNVVVAQPRRRRWRRAAQGLIGRGSRSNSSR